MVNSGELIGATEYLTLYAKRCVNRYRYKRVRLYMMLRNVSHTTRSGLLPREARFKFYKVVGVRALSRGQHTQIMKTEMSEMFKQQKKV
jgi:hypothetical protein